MLKDHSIAGQICYKCFKNKVTSHKKIFQEKDSDYIDNIWIVLSNSFGCL
jgi:hypothetical protein